MSSILVLQGPNLNLLGKREPTIYGSTTLDELHQQLKATALQANVTLEYFQSNSEEALINHIHEQLDSDCQFIIINPAAFTHTSVALRDALLSVNIPFLEVHISNVYKREAFRHHSYFSDIAIGVIAGLGLQGYDFALHYAIAYIKSL